MNAFRKWLSSIIAPCECRVFYDEGEVFIWRNVDATDCPKYRHQNAHDIVGSRDS